jgi:hypothetical protein
MSFFAKLIKLLLTMVIGAVLFLVLVATGVVEFKHTSQPVSETRFAIAKALPASNEVADQDGPSDSVEKLHHEKVAEFSETDQKDIGLYEKVLSYVERLVGDDAGDAESQLQRYLTDELGLGPGDAERFIRMCFWKNFTTLADQWPPGQQQQCLAEFERELTLKTVGFKAQGLKMTQNAKAEAEAFAKQLIAQAKQADHGKGKP